MTVTEWDYTQRAATYDKRADYSVTAVSGLLDRAGLRDGDIVADIGAGTAKLTRLLLDRGLNVLAVEPNAQMRAFGIKNTFNRKVTWSEGTGEDNGLAPACVKAVFFGSSFNVVNQAAALSESARVTAPGGTFACMWNHRDLSDPLQAAVEEEIRKRVPGYAYGKRRQDPSAVIDACGLFSRIEAMEERFECVIDRDNWMDAWRSHETLARQAGKDFDAVIAAIAALVKGRAELSVPYTTRIWHAKLK